MVEQIYETLLNYEPGGARRSSPGWPRSWSVSEDGRQWTFHLRDGVRFHDGTPFDAAAVVFSLERQRDPQHPFHGATDRFHFAYWQNIYSNVQKVEAVDAGTVRITIERRTRPSRPTWRCSRSSIVSPTAVARWGPDFYRPPGRHRAVRFVEWDRRAHRARAQPRLLGHAAASSSAWCSGRSRTRASAWSSSSRRAIDVAYSILPEELQFVELHPDLIAATRTPANSVAYLAMNTTHPPFDDVRVRRAVNYAVNKEPIVKLAYQGLATVATGPLPPTPVGLPQAARRRTDTTRSGPRALLAEAHADGRFDPPAPTGSTRWPRRARTCRIRSWSRASSRPTWPRSASRPSSSSSACAST